MATALPSLSRAPFPLSEVHLPPSNAFLFYLGISLSFLCPGHLIYVSKTLFLGLSNFLGFFIYYLLLRCLIIPLLYYSIALLLCYSASLLVCDFALLVTTALHYCAMSFCHSSTIFVLPMLFVPLMLMCVCLRMILLCNSCANALEYCGQL